MFALDRLGEDGSHHEGAECGGEANGFGERDHAEAQADAYDEQDLVVEETTGPLEDGRDQVNAHQEPQDQEKGKLGEVEQHLPAGELVGDRHRGQEHHQQDGDEVLYHQGAEDHAGPGLALEPHFVIGLEHDHRGRHRQQAAEEHAFHAGPAHGLPGHEAQHEHAQELAAGGHEGAAAYLEELFETELKAETEHQEDDADIRPLPDGLFGSDAGEPGDVRTDEEAGEDIPQDQRLLEGLGYDGEQAGRHKDDRQVPHEVQFFGHRHKFSNIFAIFA